MSVTITNIINQIDQYTSDSTTDRISTQQRYDAISEAVVWLQEESQTELQNFTYTLPYLEGLNRYNVTTTLADLIMASDLRKLEGENTKVFAFKNGKELAEDIANGSHSSAYTIERSDKKSYIVVNHLSKYQPVIVSQFEALTDGGGTWTTDTTTSDANNLVLDNAGMLRGNGCLKFDTIVAQSGNNRASIYNSTLNTTDMTNIKGLSSALLDVYLPSVLYVSSVTLTWGSSTSNYWSTTVTTDAFGSALQVGWNKLKFDWTDLTTKTGTPDVTLVNYVRIDINYTASQADTTSFRIDTLTFGRPENLTLYYLSWTIGYNSGGTALQLFSAGTDTPYFSGTYDQLKFPVAHYAAAILFDAIKLTEDAKAHTAKAYARLASIIKILPSSRARQTKSFKAGGINFVRTRRSTRG